MLNGFWPLIFNKPAVWLQIRPAEPKSRGKKGICPKWAIGMRLLKLQIIYLKVRIHAWSPNLSWAVIRKTKGLLTLAQLCCRILQRANCFWQLSWSAGVKVFVMTDVHSLLGWRIIVSTTVIYYLFTFDFFWVSNYVCQPSTLKTSELHQIFSDFSVPRLKLTFLTLT